MASGERKRGNGQGSKVILRPDGRYQARATIRTKSGLKRRASFYGATEKEARDKMLDALAAQRLGILAADPSRLTVADHLDAWLSYSARQSVSEGTYSRYQRTCRNHLKPFFGHLKLKDLAVHHVRAFKAEKLAVGLAPNTVGVMQSVLGTALNQAVADGLIPKNPAAAVKKARSREKKMRALSRDEASRLIAAAEGTREEALIVFALRTGMRQGELAALRWDDLDLSRPGKAGTVAVRRSADTRTKTRISATKTGEERTVAFGPKTATVLLTHLSRQRKERMAAKAWEDPSLVFPNTRGKVRRRDTVMRHLRGFLEKAGLPTTVRFHDLRHTAATLALKEGVPLHVVSKRLGHSDPAMTLRRYSHVLDDMQEHAAEVMDEIF